MSDLILRPNGDNTVALTPSSGSNNYAMVDESSADDDSSYVYTSSGGKDKYDLPNHSSESGTISNVRVSWRSKNQSALLANVAADIIVGGSEYLGTNQNQSSSYANYYYDWANNPKTSSAWSWSDIDALIAGVYVTALLGEVRVTQVYITVTFTSTTGVDSNSAFLKGQDTDSDSQSAYLEGAYAADSSTPAYLEGAESVDSHSAYLDGIERSTQSAFVKGSIGLFQKTLKLTIDHTQVAETHTDFPVLVKLWDTTDTQSELATVANGGYIQHTTTGGASGSVTVPADLVIAADKFNNDVYDFEIEHWDPTTGELWAWFRIPSLSSTVDTDYYINFGDSNTTISQENVGRVWLDDYEGVYHLHESSGTRYDSTNNNHHGTPVSSPPRIQTNPLYYGLDLGSDGDYVEIPWNSDFDSPDAFCLEVWTKSDTSNYSNPGWLVDFGGYDTGLGIWANSTYLYGYYNQQWQSSDITISTSSYYIYGLAYNGTTVRFIRDYSTRGSDTVSPGNIPHNPFRIGAASDAVEEYYDGWADEVRFSSKNRSDKYFETNHRMIWRYYQSDLWITIGTVEDVVQTDSQPAFLEGYTAGKSAVPAFLEGLATPSDSTPAYLKGGLEADSSQSAFLQGPNLETSSVSAYLSGPNPASDSQAAYLYGNPPPTTSSQSAWLWADWPAVLPTAKSSMAGYLEGDGVFPFSDNYTGDDGDLWNALKWDTGFGN